MRKLLIIVTTLTTFNCYAQRADTTKKNVADTVKKDLLTAPDTVRHLHSRSWTLIPPAVMIGYGAASFYVKPLRRLDHYIYGETYKHDIVTSAQLENYFQYGPVILTYGLNLVGVRSKNTFIDRTIILGMSEAMLNVSLYTVKHLTHRLRPNMADRYSFASGHTGNAFAEAEFMSQEFALKSPLYGAIGYALATTTGIFRIYHQDHWFSDVVAGAGIGILSTKGAYLLYPYIRNQLTRKGRTEERNKDVPQDEKKQRKSAIILPSYENGSLGFQLAVQL